MEAKISQKEWDEHSKKVNELHGALIGDGYGNKGYKHRLSALEDYVEKNKKQAWTWGGLVIGLSTAWGVIVKFWDNIFK
jgi:hypothetical protein